MNAQEVFSFFSQELSIEQKWNIIKGRRLQMLAECDWTQLPDAAMTFEEKAAWSDYRQALRDIPQAFTSPDDVLFPDKPGGA